MPFPFDATLKDIATAYPADYGAAFDGTNRKLRILNVDLSTISAATDVAYGFGDPLEEILDINFQSGPDVHLSGRTELYRAVLHHRYHVPVRTLIVLLRPEADHAHLSGKHAYGPATNGVQCGYEVVRLWEQPPEIFLRAGIGLLPLATLCKLPENVTTEQAIAEIVRAIDARLTSEVSEADRLRILTGAFKLSGMRLKKASLINIYGVYGMIKQTNAWEEMMYEGSLRQAKQMILRFAGKKLGPPPADAKERLFQIEDVERLERIGENILAASSWEELLEVA